MVKYKNIFSQGSRKSTINFMRRKQVYKREEQKSTNEVSNVTMGTVLKRNGKVDR
jgi:hypothetical protein